MDLPLGFSIYITLKELTPNYTFLFFVATLCSLQKLYLLHKITAPLLKVSTIKKALEMVRSFGTAFGTF